MKLTKEYILEHISDFLVKEASCTQDATTKYVKEGIGHWNHVHGGWGGYAISKEDIAKIEDKINWIYAVKPYTYQGKMTGIKPVKGFIIQWFDEYMFTTKGSINGPHNCYYGHSHVLPGEEHSDRYGELMLFTTLDEAKQAAKEFKDANELDALRVKIKTAQDELNQAQAVLDALLEKEQKLMSKK